MIDVAPFTYEELSFRPWRWADIDALAELVTDREVMAHVGGALRGDEVAGLLDRYLRVDDPRVLVALRVSDGSGSSIGSGLLIRSCDIDGAIELGFLVTRGRWGHGDGTRIASALVSLVRQRWPGTEIMASVHEDHVASIRVLEKVGLTFDRNVRSERKKHLVYRGI
jgi:RimJ/RimL family protein N-acetyltransferase